jgi:hypothetical protein
MRSNNVKQTDKIRILGFGDSVLNGGVQTEQDSLATSLIENELTQTYSKSIRCFNVSYGSWGADNCYAYLKEKGDFDADLIFLVVSSHDAYDNMDFQKIVDVHPSFPSKQYKSAIYELIDRYIIPRILRKKGMEDHILKAMYLIRDFCHFTIILRKEKFHFSSTCIPTEKRFKKGNMMNRAIKLLNSAPKIISSFSKE